MFRQIAPFIGRRILEIGAGIGNFTNLMLDRDLVVAADVYPPCVEYLEKRFADKPHVLPRRLDVADPATTALGKYDLDTVVCLNVLEHVEDDIGALSHMFAVLRSGGSLVLLVPAFEFLFGTVDSSLGHHRRYTKPPLVQKMRQSGFAIEKVFYMNLIGIAGWFLNNRVFKRTEESPKQIALFDRLIAPVAERAEKLFQPPIGLSLIAVGRKTTVS
ncbi:MAG TPA: class I SAM-dependent methyltransferase [Candidatus Binatia bacterium]